MSSNVLLCIVFKKRPLACTGDTRFASVFIMAERVLRVQGDLKDMVDDEVWQSHLRPPAAARRRRRAEVSNL